MSGRNSKDDLARYPISEGEVVAIPRENTTHIVSCIDLETNVGQLLDVIGSVGVEPIHLLYVDPPWGPALNSLFRSRAGAASGSYERFTMALVTVIQRSRAPFVVEMGNRWVQDWIIAFDLVGMKPAMIPGTYFKNRPMTYLIGNMGTRLAEALVALKGVDDALSPGVVMDAMFVAPNRHVTIFDPCCGHGLTAEHALKRGFRFVGNEIAPHRAASTLKLLHEYGR